jgi:ribosomal 50S subunit-associated protein YjgA (DUF615 family)
MVNEIRIENLRVDLITNSQEYFILQTKAMSRKSLRSWVRNTTRKEERPKKNNRGVGHEGGAALPFL